MSELDGLRAKLDELDRQLIEVLAKRMETVAQVREAKRASGKHLFDRGRERQVLARCEALGHAQGVPEELVRTVVGALFEASHRLQEQPVEETAEETASFLLVGGAGRMGRLFGRLLSARGHAVDVLEAEDALDPGRIAAADVVMVAVPMTEVVGVVRKLAPSMREDALLCDINSLKKDVCEVMHEQASCEAVGTHPMFGPTVGSLRRQKVVFCPVREGPRAAWLEAELGRMGAEVLRTDPAVHDEAMAVVQVLTHFGIMVMGRALSHSGLSLEQTLAFMSPIYRLEVSMVGRLFSQKPELYAEILMENPSGERMHRLFVEQAEQLAALAARGDREGFLLAFRETAGFFREFSSEAMELSDHIIETVMSRP